MQGTFLPTDTEIRQIVQGVRLGPPVVVPEAQAGADGGDDAEEGVGAHGEVASTECIPNDQQG
eukprot:2001280-Rhodomonas_salina.1